MSLAKRNSEAAAQWAAKRRESQERALLLERSGSSTSASARRLSSSMLKPPPRRYRASTSHEANAAYMEDFRKGMANMYLALEGSVDGKEKGDEAGAFRKTGQSRSDLPTGSSNSNSSIVTSRGSRFSGQYAERSRGAGSGFSSLAQELKTNSIGVGVASGWHQGPLDPAGNVSS